MAIKIDYDYANLNWLRKDKAPVGYKKPKKKVVKKKVAPKK